MTLRVLIVHPDRRCAARFERALRKAGHEVLTVGDGEHAIDSFIVQPADVILIGLALPGRHGEATIESIRWAPKGDRAAVILVGEPSELRDAVASRVDAVASISPDAPPTAVTKLVADLNSNPPLWATSGTIPGRLPASSSAGPTKYVFLEAEDDRASLDEGQVIEDQVRSMRAGEPHSSGKLEALAFPRLLAQLAEQRETGCLLVTADLDDRPTSTGEPPRKSVFFRNGLPIAVMSNLIEERLTVILEQQFSISQDSLRESLRRVHEGEGRQGSVLVSMGVVSTEKLKQALTTQLRTKLLDLFGWSRGTFRFTKGVPPPPEAARLEMSLQEIVWRGISKHRSPAIARARLEPHRSSVVRADPERVAAFARLELPAVCHRLLGVLETPKLIDDLVAFDRVPTEADQLLFALETIGAIRFEPPRREEGSSQAEAPPAEPSPDALEHPERDAVESDGRPEIKESSERASTAWQEATRDEKRKGDRPEGPPPELQPRDSEPPPALDSRVQRILQAELHFRRGERALHRRNYTQALSAFQEAVALCPEEGEFLAFTGYARHAAYPGNEAAARQALSELLEGIDKAPSLEVTHLLLARVRQARGELSLAEEAYRAALGANPDSSEAAEGLSTLRRSAAGPS